MKKVSILIWGLFFISYLARAQEDTEIKIINNSLTITIAPSIFGAVPTEINPQTFWPTSLYIIKNFSIKKSLSFSTGIHLLYKKNIDEGHQISEGGYSGPIKITRKYGLFDIPIRLNLHVIKQNEKTNFYIKAELKNSVMRVHLKGEPNFEGKYLSNQAFCYNMFLGIGFGLDFKLMDRLSFVIEPGLNYTILGRLPEVGLADCQVGIKYKLNK